MTNCLIYSQFGTELWDRFSAYPLHKMPVLTVDWLPHLDVLDTLFGPASCCAVCQAVMLCIGCQRSKWCGAYVTEDSLASALALVSGQCAAASFLAAIAQLYKQILGV